ncbi:MAG: ATP-binding cassette domain-containing protein [Candidatus Nanoarchaeia archaeon]|nr:ATP-binding cassette domain-containing protein [Candidatus Nanoarchaeia archaeon]
MEKSKIIIKDLMVKSEDKIILENVNIEFEFPGINLLSGENGSGKSTLLHAIFNNPNYEKSGSIIYETNGKSINLMELKTNEISKLGLFLSFQNPIEIPGLILRDFLWIIYKEKFNESKIDIYEFNKIIEDHCEKLELKKELLDRELNKNYSGGEKKKVELLQILILDPEILFLDEIDTGVDIKSIDFFIEKIKSMKDKGIVIVTHNKSFITLFDIKKEYNMSNL